jgi:hypothetical protein
VASSDKDFQGFSAACERYSRHTHDTLTHLPQPYNQTFILAARRTRLAPCPKYDVSGRWPFDDELTRTYDLVPADSAIEALLWASGQQAKAKRPAIVS